MKFNEGHFAKSDFFFRVVIKFTDGLRLFPELFCEQEDQFLKDSVLSQLKILKLFPGITIEKLFVSVQDEDIAKFVQRAMQNNPNYTPPDFYSYYTLNCPVETNPGHLLEALCAEETIEQAYIENVPTTSPSIDISNSSTRTFPNYLLPAPSGINALYAWNFKGGDGDGEVKFIDIEQGWLLEHESISADILACSGINHYDFRDHGIAVLGIVMMQSNRMGSGITPKVKGYVISQWRTSGMFNTADAIMAAISRLAYGDILLLEMQCFDSFDSDQLWPSEIQDAVFHVIQLATALGIIVIETAGNGKVASGKGNDLDQFILKGKKILDRQSIEFRDSGAILVAASDGNLPHRPTKFTNYGNRVDCFACGEKVVTAGNFPRSSGAATNLYTHCFSGTSAAAAVVAGAAIAIQNISEINYGERFTPPQMRSILSSEAYGSESVNGKNVDKIGVMPDLKKIIDNKFPFQSAFEKKNAMYKQ